MLKKVMAGVLCASLFSGIPAAFAAEEPVTLVPGKGLPAQAEKKPAAAPEQKPQAEEKVDRIAINLASRSLAAYQNGKRIRLYPIGVGKASTPTPTGYYKILDKEENPVWTDPEDGYSIPSGESNPLGYRWMQIQGNYGIHGTNKPSSVGGYVSNGCIRMFEEDVEGLYRITDVGTPVDITYNRVVVEKTPDDVVAYYIYPDGYDRQDIDVASVTEWLNGYGIADFEPDANIEAKIEASDGQPTYIGKVYPLYVNGKKLAEKAIVKDEVTYLPAVPVAKELGLALNLYPESNSLQTMYGKATAYTKKKNIYFDGKDSNALYHLTGSISNGAYMLGKGAAAPAKPVQQEPEKIVLNAPAQEVTEAAGKAEAKPAEAAGKAEAKPAGATGKKDAAKTKPAEQQASSKTAAQDAMAEVGVPTPEAAAK